MAESDSREATTRYGPPYPMTPFPPHIQAALEEAALADSSIGITPIANNSITAPGGTTSDASGSSLPGPQFVGKVNPYGPAYQPLHYFPRNLHLPTYSCRKCLTPVALQDELVSKAFSGRSGRALLLHSTQNTHLGIVEQRRLLTGIHTVADLLCSSCGTSLGWAYLKAMDRDQEYKEGKYILETARIIKENNYALPADEG